MGKCAVQGFKLRYTGLSIDRPIQRSHVIDGPVTGLGIPHVFESLNHRAHDRSTITCNLFFSRLYALCSSPLVVLSMAWCYSSESSSIMVPVRVRVRGPCGRQKEKKMWQVWSMHVVGESCDQCVHTFLHLPNPNCGPSLAPR